MRSNKGWGLEKAYQKGHRAKATCSICKFLIYNRMYFNSYKNEYAHKHCVIKEYGTLIEWQQTW